MEPFLTDDDKPDYQVLFLLVGRDVDALLTTFQIALSVPKTKFNKPLTDWLTKHQKLLRSVRKNASEAMKTLTAA